MIGFARGAVDNKARTRKEKALPYLPFLRAACASALGTRSQEVKGGTARNLYLPGKVFRDFCRIHDSRSNEYEESVITYQQSLPLTQAASDRPEAMFHAFITLLKRSARVFRRKTCQPG